MKNVLHQFCMSVALFIAHSVGHQNVPEWTPPGVHPSHYQAQQQNVPMQHMPPQQQVPVQQHVPQQQHVPVQHQGVPVQHQGVPVQHQGVPVQHQGVPVQQQPMMQQQIPVQGHHHDGPPQVLNVANIAQEKQHIQEHLSVPIDTSKMTEQELQFHYFKMHDADNNNKLDGCELIKSLIHWHEQGHAEHGKPAGNNNDKLFKDEELVSLIDPILALDDANNDGYIDYPEFVKAQQKAAVAQQQQPPQQRH